MMYGCLPFDVSSSDTISRLLKGRLPKVCWGKSDTLTMHLMQQCLIVDASERPPALELAQHPSMYKTLSASDKVVSDVQNRGCSQRRDLCEHADVSTLCRWGFAHLKSCGLILTGASKGCASPICPLRTNGVQQGARVSSAPSSGDFPSTPSRLLPRERCLRNIDEAFRQLGYAKFVRATSSEEDARSGPWSVA
eukprot:TRINITY_DN19329_c1_g1_i1.p1 TRINITY_DN19329_c1_g1~~TRINITY_DN19329_c1_g1_i1.p1  ORF type:complete len:222 (-),score=19.60 TRINITY_DN19329_c1_g1_i1:200-781(-)